jgi:hypothetical protein
MSSTSLGCAISSTTIEWVHERPIHYNVTPVGTELETIKFANPALVSSTCNAVKDVKGTTGLVVVSI